MDSLMVGALGALLLIVMLAVGMHIGLALGLIGTAGLVVLIGLKATVSSVTTGVFHFATNAQFIVLPLFVLMGLVAMQGGVSEAAFSALNKFAGKLPGAMGIAAVGGCAAFGTVCGSSLVTATVFAKVSCPEMRKNGYDKSFAYGIVSTAGMIGMLIPPSMLAVVYGLLTDESIGALLIAGVGPGLLLAVLYIVGIIVMVKLKPALAPQLQNTSFTWKERLAAGKGLWPVMVVALVVIGGIYGGIFTVSEAGAWGSLAVLIIALSWGKMRWKELANALSETVGIMAMIFLVMTAAMIFARFTVTSGVGQFLVGSVVAMAPATWQLLLGMMVLYLILGCFLGSIEMLTITIPIIYPIVTQMGIEPMWFAMVVIMSIEAGLITPPVGMNVYVVKSVAEADVGLEDIFKGVLPFLALTIIAIGLVIAIPEIANWLPEHMFEM